MVQAVGAIQGKCVDKHGPSHIHVHRRNAGNSDKEPDDLTDDAVFSFFKG